MSCEALMVISHVVIYYMRTKCFCLTNWVGQISWKEYHSEFHKLAQFKDPRPILKLSTKDLHCTVLTLHALYWQNLPKTRYLVNLRTIWEAMGNASKNFFALEGAPYMVYPYSHVKLFDNIKTSGCNSQKRCHATSGKLRPVYCEMAQAGLDCVHDLVLFLVVSVAGLHQYVPPGTMSHKVTLSHKHSKYEKDVLFPIKRSCGP